MAIERRALFALSVAITASIVAYPDLPPDIAPQAGRSGPFIGAPFVAFLLPVTALLIWWIIVSVSRQSPRGTTHARSGAAATVLFLAAFHVVTIIALVGRHLWLGRVLAVMVGVFLIATGNELPRLRPNPAWGIRNRHTLDDDDVWRRVHRVTGYLRVGMGMAVCLAALTGLPGLTQLIVLAVSLETITGIAASLFFSRRRNPAVAVLMLVCLLGGRQVAAQELTAEKVRDLPAFMDTAVPTIMEQRHVVGAAVAVVHAGHMVLLRGYGQPQVEHGPAVDASQALFRIGSVSKLFTAIAAMQLVDARRLDLQRDIRAYVPDLPLRYGATMHQLLTHTAGVDERFAGTGTDSPEHWMPLSAHLRLDQPAQVIRPGTAYSYSNYNYAVAGLVIERLSGQTYEQYVADHILRPLKMMATTARQPPEPPLADKRARGYRWTDGHQEALPFRLTYVGPSGGISASAGDMGRLMLALLEEGSLNGERILSPDSTKALLGAQYTPHPRIPAAAYGMIHWATHRQDLLFKDGTLGDQIGVVVLAPTHKLGIFLGSNATPGIEPVLDPLLAFLFGPAVPPPPPIALPDAPRRARSVAGTYRDLHHTRHDMSRLMALMPIIQSRVVADADGTIRWRGRRWLEVEPFVFRSADSDDSIAFRENAQGDIVALHAWGATYERISLWEQAPFHLGLLAACVIACVAYLIHQGVRTRKRRGVRDGGRLARQCATFVAAANLLFAAGLPVFFRGLGAPVPLPVNRVLSASVHASTSPDLIRSVCCQTRRQTDDQQTDGRGSHRH